MPLRPRATTASTTRHPDDTADHSLMLLCRAAAVLFTAASSVLAALLAAAMVGRGAAGPAGAFAADAAVLALAAAALAVARAGPVLPAVALVVVGQLLAFEAALRLGGWVPLRGHGDADDATRLLCSGTAALVASSLLAWLRAGRRQYGSGRPEGVRRSSGGRGGR